MNTAGIIGGLGPETTAGFYLKINELAEESGWDTRPPVMIWNVPLDYAVEEHLILHGEGIEKYLPYLVDSARRLEVAGADFIVMPCNTVHELFDEVSGAVSIPFLHIVKETAKRIMTNDKKQTALLATGQTVASNMYQSEFNGMGIACTVPDTGTQDQLNQVIARLVHSEHTASDAEWTRGIIDSYVASVGAVILGCTDFHIIADSDDTEVFDSMDALARATVEEMQKT